MKNHSIGETFKDVTITLDTSMGVTETRVKDRLIIGVSNHFIQLDGSMFPKISVSKTFDNCYSKPEKVCIQEYKSDFDIKYFGKFRISIYSQMSLKRIESKINREFQKWIDEKIGVYGSAKKVEIILT